MLYFNSTNGLLVIFFYEKVFFFCDGACGDARNGECKQWL